MSKIQNSSEPNLFLKFLREVKQPFDTFKKLFDLTDDFWNMAFRYIVSNEVLIIVGPKIQGFVAFVLHLFEGLNGAWIAYKALNNKNASRRETKIITGLLTAFFGTLGVSLGLTLFIAGFGISIAGSAIMPTLTTGLMSCIFATALLRRTDELIDLKKKEKKVKHEYYAMQILTQDIKTKKNKLKQLQQINYEHETGKSLGFDELNLSQQKYEENQIEIQRLSRTIESNTVELRSFNCTLEQKKAAYDKLHAKRLEAERKVAFTTLELIFSLLVLTGTILLSTALFTTATAASFGVAPIAILVTGSLVGYACKWFADKDQKKDNRFTKGIRDWFTNLFCKKNHEKNKLEQPIKHIRMPNLAAKTQQTTRAAQVLPKTTAINCAPKISKQKYAFFKNNPIYLESPIQAAYNKFSHNSYRATY